jgi:3-dehydroquinate synthase
VNSLLADDKTPQKLIVVIDKKLLLHFPELRNNIDNKLSTLSQKIVPIMEFVQLVGSEVNKNLDTVLSLVATFNDYALSRHSIVIAIGGGALLDIVGFACSIFHRGIRLVRVPTTLLSQADSGVGVKNGINHLNKKNLLGCFMPPSSIINDFSFIEKLPDREFFSALSECLKVSLIKDKAFFNDIESSVNLLNNRDSNTYERIIKHSAMIHLNHIVSSNDPFEQTNSRPLDFGHWLAHYIESKTNYLINHGEAVAIGIILDSYYSMNINLLSIDDFDRIKTTFIKLDIIPRNTSFINDIIIDDLSSALSEFAEHIGGELTITLPSSIGESIDVNYIDIEQYMKGLNYLNAI